MSDPRARFLSIHKKIARYLPAAARTVRLDVADLGCGDGAQCLVWADLGHSVHGLDIDAAAIDAARRTAAGRRDDLDYHVASAGRSPWPSHSMDICLVIEVLEHVPDWNACLDECARLLRPGGVVFISTTNRLCPRQQEFDLPLYSWYPTALKRRFERLAVTTRPDLVAGSLHPAVHWFTSRQLRRALEQRGFASVDRIDMIELQGRGPLTRGLIKLVRAAPPLRWLVQVVTPYSAVLGVKLARTA